MIPAAGAGPFDIGRRRGAWMTDEDQVRAIATSLPGTSEEPGSAEFSAGDTKFAWPYREKVHPRKARVARRDIFAFRVANEEVKFALIAGEPGKFFTTDHYNGYPAVLVRLAAIDAGELRDLLIDAHDAALQAKKRSRHRLQN
jgi:hypothetical protein